MRTLSFSRPARVAILAVAAPLLILALGLVVKPGSGLAHSCAKDNELRFRAVDGTTLVGHRFGGTKPGKRTTVVLSHMSVGDLCQWTPYARRLAAKGFFVFPFDFRGHGSSPGRQNHARAAADVVAAVRAVRALGARKVVIGGASLGGIAVVIAAPKLGTAVQGVVAVSAPAAIAGELDARPSAPRLRVPTLYLAAEEDQNAPYDFAADAQALHDATGTSEKRVEIVPGSQHGTFLVSSSAAGRALIERFLRDPAATVP
ncbi:MAG: alpha/beta hydrolase [Actinobacteria bacterium]|nr:alpha/beta hydrolase [Actinomycetota bacterium]